MSELCPFFSKTLDYFPVFQQDTDKSNVVVRFSARQGDLSKFCPFFSKTQTFRFFPRLSARHRQVEYFFPCFSKTRRSVEVLSVFLQDTETCRSRFVRFSARHRRPAIFFFSTLHSAIILLFNRSGTCQHVVTLCFGCDFGFCWIPPFLEHGLRQWVSAFG